MWYAIAFIGGVIIGGIIVFFINRFNRKDVEKTFTALSMNALQQNSSDFIRLANQTLSVQTKSGELELEGKKKLIDQTLETIRVDLQKVENAITEFEKDREKKFGEISSQLKSTADQTSRLQETTGRLQTALASTKIRGQWGERMAEDVLRLAGFVENVNYVKQQYQAETGMRPDFTFLLPRDLKLNMDVKFPLDNYMKYMDCETDEVKDTYKAQFLRDARQRIKEVCGRDYIDPAQNTVDYVLVFIPNEQVYCFINENDHSIIDEALNNRVILCSPFTLYAILAVIWKATENFNIRRTTGEVLTLMASFYKQWENFVSSMDKMGRKLDEANREYHHLITTRSNQLERILSRVEALKTGREMQDVLDTSEEAEVNLQNENEEKIEST